ncbi:MAG: hypothetical protein WCY82_04280 [Desulfotomaculaceae bacterium]
MSDTKTTGYDYPPGYPTPGYGATLGERLRSYQGQTVTLYVGEEFTEVTGMLHNVGANYAEVHRPGAAGMLEAVLIPMQYISSVVAPLSGAPHHP